jgi:mRNA-degrading endonuclease YafQ of YafQ-DinJ toxin-antitoxin module
MTPPRPLLRVARDPRFEKSFRTLAPERLDACARVIEALVRQRPTPGMRAKPILPDKHYFEARISSGDRLIFRIERGLLHLVDVVSHDDIVRYSRRPSKTR